MSWGWRKILHIRDLVRPFIWSVLGNGGSTSAWFDKWSDFSPLIPYVTPRLIANAGYTLASYVSDIVVDGSWSWPQSWYTRSPILLNYSAPNLVQDRVAVGLDVLLFSRLRRACLFFSHEVGMSFHVVSFTHMSVLSLFSMRQKIWMKMEPEYKKDRVVIVSSFSGNLMHSPNYYSDMNPEKRKETLKSAIVYCKNSPIN
ncbi:reverse transcriptase domain, Reverse transcriptase zinc-binding domain protein [Artemisia annua]|uniref:Reverse transcriptase domain, Reverse transcriptase zinc-binding domain protein n=1 Tax=Artemisia annua TaxID=35608 RepID=A0A2U1N0Z5_ARTAN|nr:reverse transcriptase domain, Reverse transcriptase zinc-binding domain protein [Artemisia annua]